MNNRIIKFRVWDKKLNQFWHQVEGIAKGGVIISADGYPGLIVEPDSKASLFELKNLVVQQFTGLLDKNGKEIYESDLLRTNYISSYEILNSAGEFEKWADDKKEFQKLYEVVWYTGDYPINYHEYTIGLNGWVVKLVKDTRRSTLNETGSICSLSAYPEEENYGFFGLVAQQAEIIGNIFENSELINE